MTIKKEDLQRYEWENSSDWRVNPNLPLPVGAKALKPEQTKNRMAARKQFNEKLNAARKAHNDQVDRLEMALQIMEIDGISEQAALAEADRLMKATTIIKI